MKARVPLKSKPGASSTSRRRRSTGTAPLRTPTWSTWPSTSPQRPTAAPTGWSPLRRKSMQASSSLDVVLGLRSTLAAGEGEVGLGVVGADPASPYYGEAESEAAGQDEER